MDLGGNFTTEPDSLTLVEAISTWEVRSVPELKLQFHGSGNVNRIVTKHSDGIIFALAFDPVIVHTGTLTVTVAGGLRVALVNRRRVSLLTNVGTVT